MMLDKDIRKENSELLLLTEIKGIMFAKDDSDQVFQDRNQEFQDIPYNPE